MDKKITFLRLPTLMEQTGLSRSTIYRLMKNNKFPKPVNLGARSVGWINEEVKQWAAERIAMTRNARGQNGKA